MGLFSKKTYVCEKCGKEFEKRLNLLGSICDECWLIEENERKELENAVKGYNDYCNNVFYKSHSTEELRNILNHREELLGTLQNENAITREELIYAGNNYKGLSEEEAMNVIVGMLQSQVYDQAGAGVGKNFFVLKDYDGVLVDAKDVFAIGFTTDARAQVNSSEVLLCALFTNDPYVPVVPLIYVVKKGFFEFSKSKEGREAVVNILTAKCPNLTYAVQDLNELKKRIKRDGCVKGKLNEKFMLDQIGNATAGIGIFDVRKMNPKFTSYTTSMLNRMGYLLDTEIEVLLKWDKTSNRKYWSELMDRM